MTYKFPPGRFTSSKWFRAALVVFCAAVYCSLLLRNPLDTISLPVAFDLARPGSLLLAGLPARHGSLPLTGLPGGDLTYWMPLFGTVFSAALNIGITPLQFLVLVNLGILALVFCAACLLRGYWAGVLSLASAAFFTASGRSPHNLEQDFYALFVLLALALLLLKRRENTFKADIMAGLAVGASMLVRSPLSFFPPVLVLCEALFWGGRSRAFILRSLAFLAASYVLLVPWGALKYSLTGKFALIDSQSAADNIITGALGSIYCPGGDSRRLAGLGAEDSALVFYVREAVKDPVFYAVTVTRRLQHIFLYFPLLFGLFLAALLLKRDRDSLQGFCLPVYFILIHSLFSISRRYFLPLAYVLPPLLAGSLLPRGSDSAPAGAGAARKAMHLMFWLSFSVVLAVEGLIAAYHPRSVRNIADGGSFSAALARFPDDRVVQRMKCEEHWEKGRDAEFYKCLGAYSEKFGDKIEAYFVSAMTSRVPDAPEFPPGSPHLKAVMPCYIIKMLREFELGDQAAGRASFGLAYAEYEAGMNWQPSAPYEKDRELMLLRKQDTAHFWDIYVYDYLTRWRPGGAAKILSGIEKNFGLTPKMKALKNQAKEPPPSQDPG